MQVIFLTSGKNCIIIKNRKTGGLDVELVFLLAFSVAFVFLLVKSIVLSLADHKEGFAMRWNTFVSLILTAACLCGMMLCMVSLQ